MEYCFPRARQTARPCQTVKEVRYKADFFDSLWAAANAAAQKVQRGSQSVRARFWETLTFTS